MLFVTNISVGYYVWGSLHIPMCTECNNWITLWCLCVNNMKKLQCCYSTSHIVINHSIVRFFCLYIKYKFLRTLFLDNLWYWFNYVKYSCVLYILYCIVLFYSHYFAAWTFHIFYKMVPYIIYKWVLLSKWKLHWTSAYSCSNVRPE